MKRVLLFLATGLLLAWPVQGQSGSGIHTLQVTIGASATKVSTAQLLVYQVTVQNNASHAVRVGDSTASSSVGALLASGSPGGSVNFGPLPFKAIDLSKLYVAGTQNDVIDVVYIQ